MAPSGQVTVTTLGFVWSKAKPKAKTPSGESRIFSPSIMTPAPVLGITQRKTALLHRALDHQARGFGSLQRPRPAWPQKQGQTATKARRWIKATRPFSCIRLVAMAGLA